jgi:tRNA nucleotidyltransferase/poly(A) polymerase
MPAASWGAGPGSAAPDGTRYHAVMSSPHQSPARRAGEQIIKTLAAAGHLAYFAGGCVRDELLGLTPSDYDVATDATPDRICSLFPRTSEVGAAFGVVLVREGREQTEVATFRSEGPYSDRRRPDTVAFSNPLVDARRRDYTVNALFLDPAPSGTGQVEGAVVAPHGQHGRVIDYVGGLVDLERRVLRAVGNPDERLAEDHLRALRAARLAAKLGFHIEGATAGAIRDHAAELRGVSRERIGEEVRQMAEHPSRAAAAKLVHELGLEEPVFMASNAGPRTWAVLAGLSPEVALAAALGGWALDMGLDAGHADETVRRWRGALSLSNEERDLLRSVLSTLPVLEQEWPKFAVAKQKRLAAAPWFGEALALFRAVSPASAASVEDRIGALAKTAGGLWPPPFITGDDLVGTGMTPGPAFKRVLDEVFDAQLEGKVTSKAQALELAKRLSV